MYKETAKLILYRSFGDHSILSELSKIFHDFDAKTAEDAELIERIYTQIKALLDLATSYGFDENLWHNYLTFLLLMNENSFSLVSEKSPVQDGSVHHFAKNDFRVVKRLFDFDFHPIEKALGIDCFSTISNYKAVAKKERMYNRNVSAMVQRISRSIETAADEEEIFQIITTFYQEYGVGMFGLNKAFRIRSCENGDVEFLPINNMDSVILDDLIGYQMQKDMLRENTQAFVEGRNANNALLYGDSGTGKSTSIKAIVNEYYKDGLRMIEIYKHQFKDLSTIISHIKNRNYRFIIYMDDLSFEEFEIEYKFLKAVIEGGVETKPDNVLIYATGAIWYGKHGRTATISMTMTSCIIPIPCRRSSRLWHASVSASAMSAQIRRTTLKSSRSLPSSIRKSHSVRRSCRRRPENGGLVMAETAGVPHSSSSIIYPDAPV